MHLGRGASAAGLRDSTNVLADAVEALIAAVYLDVGLEAARLACARISLRYALAGGGQIPIVADGEVNEVVQLVTAKSAVPVLGGPGSARTRAVLERRRHVSRQLQVRPGDAPAREGGAQASRSEPFA